MTNPISERTKPTYKIAQLLSVMVTLLGAAALIGWMWNIPAFKSILPGFAPMEVNDAIALVLCGSTLALLSQVGIRRPIRLIAMLVGILMIILGLLTLGSGIFGWNINLAGFNNILNIKGSFTLVQMSSLSAYGYVLIGCAFLIESSTIVKSRLSIQCALAVMLIFIGGFSLLGQAMDAMFTFRIWHGVDMAFPLAIAFIFMGAVILIQVRYQYGFKWVLNKLTVTGFGLSVIALLTISSGFTFISTEMQKNASLIIYTEDTLKEVGELLSSLFFQEHVIHEYIIAGDEQILNAHLTAPLEIQANMQDLYNLSHNNIHLQAVLKDLAPMIVQRLDWIDQIVKVRRLQGFSAAQQMMSKDKVNALVDKMTLLLVNFQSEEYVLLANYQSAGEKLLIKNAMILPIMIMIGITILFLGLLFFNEGINKQKQLEEQLRQSQKMESLGQLTGGVAHDFNNLLGIILGNLDLLLNLVKGNEAATKKVHVAEKAALRGADLTKRLLMFSSQQPLNSKAISINTLIQNTIDMSVRTLGPEVKIATELDQSITQVLADGPGFENALLNLAINARDAMPKGGTLTVSTKPCHIEDNDVLVQMKALKAGHYARINVSDTGSGMSKETVQRAFEPFFTTKPRGKGTGLGLSMVYGFAKQSGGYAKIYSELGHGTSISMYLPLADHPVQQAFSVEKKTVMKINAIALVVDDEAELLEIEVAYLEELGFTVFQAQDVVTALAIVEKEPKIDLLVTDIIMPGSMNGVELAQKVHQLRTNIKILYVSGFPARTLTEKSGVHIDAPLLLKPFQKQEFIKIISNIMTESST